MAVEEKVFQAGARKDERPLEDVLVGKLVKLGRACADDLAGEIGTGVRPQDLVPALTLLESNGVIRRSAKDKDDPRDYNEHQIVYEIKR